MLIAVYFQLPEMKRKEFDIGIKCVHLRDHLVLVMLLRHNADMLNT